jgi:hypothetical protein
MEAGHGAHDPPAPAALADAVAVALSAGRRA